MLNGKEKYTVEVVKVKNILVQLKLLAMVQVLGQVVGIVDIQCFHIMKEWVEYIPMKNWKS